MACLTLTMGSGPSIYHYPKQNWLSHAVGPAFMPKFIAFCRSVTSKPNTPPSASPGMRLKTIAPSSLAGISPSQLFERKRVTKHEHYTQRALIAELFAYQLWSADFLPQLAQQSAQIVRRDVTPGFIVTELITWLNEHKIVRPGYTTLQGLISEALSAERRRLGALLAAELDDAAKAVLAQLLVRDDTLSELAALKQDAKNFGWRQMAKEREKLSKLEPLYRIAKVLLPKLAISQQNLHYYSVSYLGMDLMLILLTNLYNYQ